MQRPGSCRQRSAHVFLHARRRGQGGGRRVAVARPRRNAGRRRRERMRQVRHRAVGHAPGAARFGPHRGGQHPLRRQGVADAGTGSHARDSRQSDQHDLPGADDEPQSGHDRGQSDRRKRRIAPASASARGAGPRDRDAYAREDPRAPENCRRVSASAFRRHAATRHDRHRDGLHADDTYRRRADDGARRHHPGADPRSDAGNEGAHRRRGHAHHA